MEETLKDDTSELREVPLPNLLISSLEHIQNTKSKPHMEAGVESLPQNLRGAADSMLDRLASILTRSLLHLWSVEVFDSDEHQKQAFLGLTTVMSKRPLLAYPMALRVICDKEHMLHQRTIALEAIEASAFTLANSPSGTGKEESSQEKRGNSRKWINVSNENKISPEAKRWEIIRARVEARASTRRWSRRRPAPKTSINRFGSVSMSVFAPLLAISLKIASGMRDNLRYSIHNGTAKPFEEGERTGDAHDRILFGSIIRCLGTLLSCAGRSAPGTWAMAQSLLDLLFITRFHPVKEIRRETLVALGKALQAVPPAILHNKMYGELVEVVEWLQDVCKIDPDSECREIATAVAALIQKSLKEAKMSISSRPIIRVGHARSGGILDIAKSGGAGTLALAELKSVTL
uniref:Telomere length regulation protein conserved domain-containing protein n=1 Tax=Amorphochlora amoebiformis TaxID=1561963 RepID=A0A7S0GW16_9EUKA